MFRIESDIPPGSGLGGSGVLTVTAIGLSMALLQAFPEEEDHRAIALLAHFVENWLGFSSTGFQDQIAAANGGANLWSWGANVKGEDPLWRHTDIMPRGGSEELGRHLLLCFTGQPHARNRAGEQFRTLPKSELRQWEKVADLTDEFSTSLKAADWARAAHYLDAECALREEITPDCLSSRARQLADAARQCGAGCRYAGHGPGGCMWAVGDTDAIRDTGVAWRRLAKHWKEAWVISPTVAAVGLTQEAEPET